jgi:hypothetical protein
MRKLDVAIFVSSVSSIETSPVKPVLKYEGRDPVVAYALLMPSGYLPYNFNNVNCVIVPNADKIVPDMPPPLTSSFSRVVIRNSLGGNVPPMPVWLEKLRTRRTDMSIISYGIVPVSSNIGAG